MGVSQVPGLEQNYQYGLYGQGSKIPFGGLTVGPKVTPLNQPRVFRFLHNIHM